MRKLHLDFSSPRRQRINIGGIILFAAGLLAAAWIVKSHNEAKTEQLQLQSAQERRHRAEASIQRPSMEADATIQYQKAAAVIDQLSFPWDRLFSAIEKNTTSDVALLSIQPNLEAKTIALDAESRNWSSMLAYVKRLEEDGFFSDVHLINHQTQVADPQRPLRFRLECRWQSLLGTSVNTSTSSILGQ
jgi:Tfp pilus assembly protein PilN